MASIYEIYSQSKKDGQEDRRVRTLGQHYQQAAQGDKAAQQQVYAVDQSAGMQAQKFARETADDDMDSVAKAATFYAQTRDPKAYQYMHAKLATMPQFAGMPANIDSPEDQDGSVKFAQAIAQTYGGRGTEANNVQSRFINDGGEMVALMRDGSTKVVGKADASNQIIEGEGGFFGVNRRSLQAAPVQLGGGQPQMPQQQAEQMPNRGDMEADITLANQMIASGIPEAQVDAFIAARGQRASGAPQMPPMPQQQMPAAQLRPAAKPVNPFEERRLQLSEEGNARANREEQRKVQAGAVAGKPPNDGERAAFGYLGRMQAAEKLMQGVESAGYTPGGYADTVSSNLASGAVLGPLFNAMTSSEGQQYRQAQEDWVRAKLRKESGAVIGDEEMEREIRVYFAQPNDDKPVREQKAAARIQAEKQVKSMAGRAMPQGSAGPREPSGPKPGAANRIQSAADYDALPSGSLFIAPDGTQRRKR